MYITGGFPLCVLCTLPTKNGDFLADMCPPQEYMQKYAHKCRVFEYTQLSTHVTPSEYRKNGTAEAVPFAYAMMVEIPSGIRVTFPG